MKSSFAILFKITEHVYKEELEVNLIDSKTSRQMGLIRPTYQIIKPLNKGHFIKQWGSCLQQIIDIAAKQKLSPFRVNIFVKSVSQLDYKGQHQIVFNSMMDELEDKCPPFGLVMQEPAGENEVICEVGFVNSEDAVVKYGSFQDRPYCIVETPNYREFWTIGAQTVDSNLNTLKSSNEAFQYLKDLYDHLGITFNNIVRQWNYVGEILSKEQEETRLRQHYQVFNETRSVFYGANRTRSDFPAATGIGMLHNGVCIDSFAVSGSENLKVLPISNPDQNESYQYGQKVLVGDPNKTRKQNQPPQFERATLVELNGVSRLIISGTASIIGQETIGLNDVEEQTRITIQNIDKLCAAETLKKQHPEIQSIPIKYSYIRVYVKHKKDMDKVKSICEAKYGDAPTAYVVADVCRDNLLIEIEAELTS